MLSGMVIRHPSAPHNNARHHRRHNERGRGERRDQRPETGRRGSGNIIPLVSEFRCAVRSDSKRQTSKYAGSSSVGSRASSSRLVTPPRDSGLLAALRQWPSYFITLFGRPEQA